MKRGGGQTGVPEDEFLTILRRHGIKGAVRELNVTERAVHARRAAIEKRTGARVWYPGSTRPLQGDGFEAREFIEFKVRDGTVLIGSDAHYWPGMISTAHEGFVKFAKEMQPAAVILNGDVIDGATISRFPPPGWEYQPEVYEEIETCLARLKEIKDVAPDARRIWTYGNHDQRVEMFVATHAKEFKGVEGFHLHDHFNDWERCWGAFINHKKGTTQGVCVKHRFKGGVHAAYNNIVHSGLNMVTGHLHSAKVSPKTNYNGTCWGVDCGTLAEPHGRQFTGYTEAGPVDWRSGFAVLTFKDGQLLQPELCLTVEKGVMQFRGEHIEVSDD